MEYNIRKFQVTVERPRPISKLIIGFLFSHVGLFLMSIGFAILGAYLFVEIELPNEELQKETKIAKTKEVEDSLAYLRTIFWVYANNQRYNFSENQYKDAVKSDLETLKRMIVHFCHNYEYDGTYDWTQGWTIPNALLFTLTIITTLGYGQITPQTQEGKMLCIPYALIGIPLLLIFMANFGDLMAYTIKWSFRRICCGWCRYRRRKEVMLPNVDIVSEPINKVKVPIIISVMIILLFLSIGAAIFSNWENWSLGTSFYFSFITLTTIGFGDKVPTKSFLNYKNSFEDFLKMVFTLAYIIAGIALLSMCIQLMQEEIVNKISRFSSKIGLKGTKDQLETKDAVEIPENEVKTEKPDEDLCQIENDFIE